MPRSRVPSKLWHPLPEPTHSNLSHVLLHSSLRSALSGRYQEVAMGGGQQEIAVTLLKAASQAREKNETRQKINEIFSQQRNLEAPRKRKPTAHKPYMHSDKTSRTCGYIQSRPRSRFSTVMRRRSKIPPSP